MRDIVEELRSRVYYGDGEYGGNVYGEAGPRAADEIERLRRELAEARRQPDTGEDHE